MKTKLTMMVAMTAACAATQLTAMPKEEETRQAEPVVRRLLASEREELKSGRKTRSDVADAARELADEADSDAAKLLLMKGAFVLYVRDGNLKKAVETMNALEAAIADMPPQSVTNMIEMALLGASTKVDGAQLYKLLGATKADIASKEAVSKSFSGVGYGTETVDGYTWSYRVKNGEATIVAEKDGKKSCAVSPTPTGDISIPATLGGVKVTRIGWEAFRNCKGLTSVTIPEGVTYIDYNAFSHCGLKSVTLPSSLKVIGWAAFGKCAELTSIEIPNGVKSIEPDAFNGCTGLKSVVIPENVTRIGDRAFLCSGLESVTIPAKVVRINEGAFGGCSELKQINVAAGNHAFTLIDGVLYPKDMSVLLACPGTMTSVTIPSGVTKIGAFSFRGCKSLTSVTISESVTNISTCAFQDCSNLKRLTMLGERPEARKDIFKGWGYLKKSCDNLTSIHVPANAKSWAGMKEWLGIPLVFDAK